MRTRVTVVLRERDAIGAPMSEWAHAGDYHVDEGGCTLTWGEEMSYFPWPSVLRVDWSPCNCRECSRKEGP